MYRGMQCWQFGGSDASVARRIDGGSGKAPMVRHQRDPCKAGWMAAPTPATEPLDHRFARRLRLAKVRTAMVEAGVDALLLSLGADLPWMTGYTAMPLERLTMLVLPADGVRAASLDGAGVTDLDRR
jgi:hypothetical protein